MAQSQIEDETEVFDDTVLQYLSAICPDGMHNDIFLLQPIQINCSRLYVFQESSNQWSIYG